MNNCKNGNLMKLVAFFLICAVLTCTVAYASGTKKDQNDEENGKTEDNLSNGDTDSNTNNENPDGTKEDPPSPDKEKQYHYITGLETEASLISKIPIAITLDSSLPSSCLLACYLTIELPIENGETRLIGFTDDALTLSKIGSLSSTRDYFLNVCSYFGAISLYFGRDSSINKEKSLNEINIKECIGYYFNEEAGYFTSGELLSMLIIEKGIATVRPSNTGVPYTHVSVESEPVMYSDTAKSVKILYSDSNYTEISYSSDSQSYRVTKQSGALSPSDGAVCEYKNAFILFADAVTYESSNSTVFSMNTSTGGRGYYFTMGTYKEITWALNDKGELIFSLENGDKLTVNRGTSYISYVKSSGTDKVSIS